MTRPRRLSTCPRCGGGYVAGRYTEHLTANPECMGAERITTDGAPDAWVCVCGNEPHCDGFYPSDLTGTEQEPTIDGPWDGVHLTCAACGRVIDQVTLAVVARGTFVPLEVTP